MEIPVLIMNRTVGTQRESGTREWINRDKRRRRHVGKSACQAKDVTCIEIKVEKSVSQLSRKAAIVSLVPVP